MTEKRRITPEEAHDRSIFFAFILNPGLATYVRDTLASRPVQEPPDEASRARYRHFIKDEVMDKAPEELAGLHRSLQEYEEVMKDIYTDDNYSSADIHLDQQ